MLISMNWISDFVDLNGIDLKELINKFTLSTAEVEDIFEYGKDIFNVVTAKIMTVCEHPSSKKLHILTVYDGENTVQVVCGAPNVKPNMIVPFARENSIVQGQKISASEILGVMSCGMCLSEKELGISDDHSGLMELSDDILVGLSVKELLPIEDIVFEVDNKSLTNRPDLWGHYGIAREIAVLTGRELKPLELAEMECYKDLPSVDISIHDSEKCLRYTSVVIKNITQKVSPVNMKIRLYYCGMRALNLLADLTNYLMLELGQPMHAFDNNLVDKITVKTFGKEFDFETLDGEVRKIPTDTLMICTNNEPVAIAGVMGGAKSAILENTDSVLLEAANFDGVSVRKTSTKLGLRTEASTRYEKVLDPELTIVSTMRFLKLLQEIDCEAKITSNITDIYLKKYPIVKLQIEKAYIDKYTGININNENIIHTLTALGFDVSLNNDVYNVTVPSFRATKDISIKADLIEEITRIYGYDNFEVKTNSTPLVPVHHSDDREKEYAAKLLLVQEYSMNEVHSYMWYNTKLNKELGLAVKENVKILNSVSPETSVLREYMAPTLINIARQNKSGFSEIGIFEIGKVVKGLKADGSCNEQKTLGILFGSKTLSEKELFYKTKSAIGALAKSLKNITPDYTSIQKESFENWMHPYNSRTIVLGNIKVGYITVLHPTIKNNLDKKFNITIGELDFGVFSGIIPNPVKYVEVSRFPGTDIDLSFLVEQNMQYDSILSLLSKYSNEYLQNYEFVDVYEDDSIKGKKSVTIRFFFNSMEKTLSGEEVETCKHDIIELMQSHNVKLR